MLQFQGNLDYKKGQFGAWTGIAGNVFLSLIKFLAGIFGHSAAMVADAIHSLSDILSSVIVLIGLKVARKRPDAEHPYGHSKAESVAAQIISLFMVFLGGMIFFNSWKNLFKPKYEAPSYYVLLVAFVSIVIKEGLFHYKNRLGKKIHSSSLVADAWHHRSDAFSSLVVLIGVSLVIIGGPRFHIADPIAAMAVALIICYTGVKMLLKTSSELMDQVLTGPPAEKIKMLIMEVKGVKAVEKLFIRKSGMDLIIDIHIEVDPTLSVVEGHNIAGEVKAKLMEKIESLRSVMVHVEPYLIGSRNQGNTEMN
ncbi:MAG: cation diffusion facilitator family transporter [Candidatus Auribacterota bacterium]|nr:cation diffusion facilitator family transporter [Candidatus Auribacterota bacterium]